MPRSKKARVVNLTNVKKNKERKGNLFMHIREKATEAKYVYVIRFHNLRTNYVQSVRTALKPGVLVFGRSRIMQKALTDEFVNAPEGIEGLAPLIRGSRALLFTSEEPKKINQFFESYNPEEFARGGFIADRTIVLQKGVESLSKFPGNMEVQLRKLGLTTSLKEGVIHLLGDFNVCKAGKPLTPEQAQIVKLLGIKMAKFSGEVVAVYNSADSGIEKFVDENEDDDVDAEFEDIEEIEIDHENMA